MDVECKVSFEGLCRLQMHVLDEEVFDLSKIDVVGGKKNSVIEVLL